MGIRLKSVTKTFLSKENRIIRAVEDVSFHAQRGKITTLLGPTGSGKTTILRLIGGLETPDSGEIIFNSPVDDKKLGYVTQYDTLFPWKRIGENIGLPLRLRGERPDQLKARVGEIARMVGLEGVTDLYPYEVSGGMIQRAAIGRLIASDAGIWLMDEPFSSLDEKTRHRLQDILLSLVTKRGVTVVFVTHSIDEAVYLSDRVVILSSSPGRVVDLLDLEDERPRDRLSTRYGEIMERLRMNLEEVLKG